MGLKTSPNQTCQAMLVAEYVIRGNRLDGTNPFRWDVVRLNLPGSKGYDPRLPWVSKIRLSDGKIACDIFIYVDDLRITGPTKNEAWEAAHRVGCGLFWLGVQDTSRKRRYASRTAGAWAGNVVYTTEEEVYVFVTKEKWTKEKVQVTEVLHMLRRSRQLSRKRLQEIRGYLNYIAQTYPILQSHLTIDGRRENRDEDGWRVLLDRDLSISKKWTSRWRVKNP